MTETEQEVLAVIHSLFPDFSTNLRKWILFVATGQDDYAPSDEEICYLLKNDQVAQEVLSVVRNIPPSWIGQHAARGLPSCVLTVKAQKS